MIAQKIAERIGQPDLINVLANELTSSELNSVWLDVLARKTQQMSPSDLLRAYQENRFVKPADVDVTGLRELEDQALAVFSRFGFQPVELSPVAPLGSCSVVATVDQKKVLSATRQTEVVADATNALALHIADLRHAPMNSTGSEPLRFSTVHRHIRTPPVPDKPGIRPHFKIACFVTAGRDTGHYQFEKEAFTEQATMINAFFRDMLPVEKLTFRLHPRTGYPDPVDFVSKLTDHLRQRQPYIQVEMATEPIGENKYYNGLQYKIVIDVNGQTVDIGDGGFVDWTQQLVQNKKERLLTTGIGIELLYRLLHP